MSVTNDIAATQVFLSGSQPVSQSRTVSDGTSQEIDSGYLQSDGRSKITTGTVPVSFLQSGLGKSSCRCGSCPECAAQAYNTQANMLLSDQPTTEHTPQTILPDESTEQPLSLSEGQKGADGEPLSQEELAQLTELKKRDRVVRAHEQAHMAAAAGIVTKGMSFSYQQGSDGKRYAVGGEVQIDAGKEATPTETIAKMKKVRAAALAPAEPSTQDRKVAASATTKMSQARVELRVEQTEEAEEQREAASGTSIPGLNDSAEEDDDAKVSPDSFDDKMPVPAADNISFKSRNITLYSRSRDTYLIPSQFHVQA